MSYGMPRTLLPIFDELRGEHVVVRPYRESDAADLQVAVDESREHVRPWLPFADEHRTVDESRDWIIRCAAASPTIRRISSKPTMPTASSSDSLRCRRPYMTLLLSRIT